MSLPCSWLRKLHVPPPQSLWPHLEELEAEADEAEVFRRLRARLGDTDTPSFFLGDLDRRQGSFHSSARFTWGPTEAPSFFGGSAWRLGTDRGWLRGFQGPIGRDGQSTLSRYGKPWYPALSR